MRIHLMFTCHHPGNRGFNRVNLSQDVKLGALATNRHWLRSARTKAVARASNALVRMPARLSAMMLCCQLLPCASEMSIFDLLASHCFGFTVVRHWLS